MAKAGNVRLPIYTRIDGREHALGVIEVPIQVVLGFDGTDSGLVMVNIRVGSELEDKPLVPPREDFLRRQSPVDIPGSRS